MDWSNVSTIQHCKYSFSKYADIEVFSYQGATLTRRLSTGEASLSFHGKSVHGVSSALQLLKALHYRLYKHPMLMYQHNELTLFDVSDECVSALLQ